MAHKSDNATLNSNGPAPQDASPIRLVVRRGADRRFEALKAKTAHLKVVVTWDQRQGERRAASDARAAERRNGDRRRTAAATWDLADFVVVTPRSTP